MSLEQECMKVAEAEADLSTAQGEVQVAQATLDQLGTAFLQAAADRDHLLSQWEVALDHIFRKASENTACIEVLMMSDFVLLCLLQVHAYSPKEESNFNMCKFVLLFLSANSLTVWDSC